MTRPKSGGYGRPPVETRFRPGQSGNRKGRPPGSKNLTTLVRQALNEKVTIQQNGRTKRVTKSEVIAKQLVNQAAAKDWTALRLLLGFYQLFGEEPVPARAENQSMGESDRAILERLKTRLTKVQSE